jgi:glycosyltransferase involved in cell wall biosynthesis
MEGRLNNIVSIIVPVYNTEKYLPRCIESILEQTYKNIELILINDGSSDRSGEICDEFARKDNRIIVEHRKNSGVSDARNTGILMCSGEYLQFVDSDDYIDKDMTRLLVNAIKFEKADLVICGYIIMQNENGEYMIKSYSHDKSLSFEQFMDIYDELYSNIYLNLIWNKIYSTRIIKENKIIFNSNFDLGEDLLFNLEVIKRCNNFSIIPSSLYYYVQYNDKNNLTRKPRENIYEIQKQLFQRVIEVAPKGLKYSNNLINIEKEYSRILISDVIANIINNIDLFNCEKFIQQMKKIHKDEVLVRTIESCNFNSRQEKLIRYFLQHNRYISLYIYAKIKKIIKNKFSLVLDTKTLELH